MLIVLAVIVLGSMQVITVLNRRIGKGLSSKRATFPSGIDHPADHGGDKKC
ncbi:hypothetical protein D3C79_1066020 [compost metagenome]